MFGVRRVTVPRSGLGRPKAINVRVQGIGKGIKITVLGIIMSIYQ